MRLAIIWFFSYAVHLEFHITRDTAGPPDSTSNPARTKWVVIRCLRDDIAKCFSGGFNTIRVLASLLAQLRRLEAVYLEAREPDHLDSGAGLYAKLEREQVVQRTCRDAHGYAGEARTRGVGEGQPLSPVWCLETYEEFRREWCVSFVCARRFCRSLRELLPFLGYQGCIGVNSALRNGKDGILRWITHLHLAWSDCLNSNTLLTWSQCSTRYSTSRQSNIESVLSPDSY